MVSKIVIDSTEEEFIQNVAWSNIENMDKVKHGNAVKEFSLDTGGNEKNKLLLESFLYFSKRMKYFVLHTHVRYVHMCLNGN